MSNERGHDGFRLILPASTETASISARTRKTIRPRLP